MTTSAVLRWVSIFGVSLGLVSGIALADQAGRGDPDRVVFEENRGQAGTSVEFFGRGPGLRLLLGPTGATLLPVAAAPGGEACTLELAGGATDPALVALEPLPGRTHYLWGPDADAWITGVPTYGGVEYREVYPGIDAAYLGRGAGFTLRFRVAPNHDASSIALRPICGDDTRLLASGEVVLRAAGADVRLGNLRIAQRVDGVDLEIDGRFLAFEGGSLGIAIGEHDPGLPLVIETTLAPPARAAVDVTDGVSLSIEDAGSIVIAGRASAGGHVVPDDDGDAPWPVEAAEAFVMRLDTDGSSVLSTTYFGGAAADVPLAVAAAPNGEIVVAGRTDSVDFPLTRADSDTPRAGSEAFVARLHPDGAAWVYSLLLGGEGDDRVAGVAVDASSNVWIVGTTDSADFPIDDAALARNPAGGTDVFVTRIDRDSAGRSFTRYLGGIADDVAEAIAVGPDGTAYIAGATRSREFLTVRRTTGLRAATDGDLDAFVASVRPDDGTPGFVTFLGGSADDAATGVAVAADGRPVIVGWSRSDDLPVSADAAQSASGGRLDGFFARLDADGRIDHATYLGGAEDDRALGVAVDDRGGVWVAGSTRSIDFPGARGDRPGGLDGVLVTLDAADLGSPRAAFVGQPGDDALSAVVVSPDRRPVVAGVTDARESSSMRTIESDALLGDAFVGSPPPNAPLAAGCPGTINFDNDAGNLAWATASNWDTDALPTATDDVCIDGFAVSFAGLTQSVLSLTIESAGSLALSSGTLTVSTGSQVDGGVLLSGATITGDGDLTVLGAFEWTGGTISGTGELNPAGGLAISGTATKLLSRTLNNTATTTIDATNNSFFLATGGVFHNMPGATFDSQNDTYINFGGGSPAFINEGAFVKSAGTGTTQFASQIAFANDGVVDVQTGTLRLNRTATHTGSFDCTGARLSFGSGTHDLAPGQTLTGTDVFFDAGTINVPGGYDVTGTTIVSGSTVNFTGSITNVGTLTLESGTLNLSNSEGAVAQSTFDMTTGTLTGTSDLDVTGMMTWTGGTISGTGELNPAGGLAISGTATKLLSRTLNNTATTTIDATNNSFFLATGGVFHNMPGATFDSQNDTYINFGGGSPAFINEGAFVKSAGTGTTQFASQIAFANDGVVDVQTGTLRLNRTATHTGSFDCTGARLSFGSGTHDLAPGQTLTGTDVFFDAGTINVPGGYDVTGTTIVSGSTVNFTGSITNVGTLTLESGTLNLSNSEGAVAQSTFDMTTGTLTGTSDLDVTGMMTWTGGTISGTGELNPAGGLAISGTATKLLSRTLNNTATTTIDATNNSFFLATGGVFHNMPGATFDSQNDTYINFGGGSPAFINEGAFVKSAGTGTTQFASQIAFANDGVVDVQTGTLRLNRTATHTGSFDCTGARLSFGSGTHDLAPGQTLTGTDVFFDAGTINVPGGYDVTGTTIVSGSTVNFTGSITNVGTLTLESGTLNLSNSEGAVAQSIFDMTTGTLTGTSDLDVTGMMTWTGGTISGTGELNPAGGLAISGTATKLLSRTLNNTATTTIDATNNSFFLATGGVFHNMPGATFDSQNDTYINFGGGSPAFINEGAFVKSAGTGTTQFATQIAFANDGVVDVQTGTLRLNRTATHTGSFDCTGARLSFGNGTHDLAPGQTLTGTDVFFDAGTINVPGSYDVTGTTVVSGSTVNLTGSITGLGALTLESGTLNLSNVEGSVTQATFVMSAGTLTGSSRLDVTGSMHWTGGTLSGTGPLNALGALSIADGATKFLARTLNASATATLGITTNSLYLMSDGALNVLPGATLDVTDNGDLLWNGGAPVVNNGGLLVKSAGAGTTAIANSIAFTNTGAIEVRSGTLDVRIFTQTAGSTTLDGGALASGGVLAFDDGLLTGVGTVTAPAVDSSGQVAPGVAAIGVLAIDGAYAQSATGTFQVELGGVGCTDADRLDVSGAVTIDGTLDVTLVDGCMPVPGQSFTLITGASAAGAFPNFTPPATDCPMDWNVVVTPTTVVLEVTTGTCVDGDGDTFSDCCGTCVPAAGDQCTDCDDADPATYPGAPELCDGTDNDCDSAVPGNEIDDDGDLYVECAGWNDTQGDTPSILGGADCDDADATSYPGAAEVCDGNDNDCDATVPADETDDDGDLYVECSTWNDSQADQPTILGGADCDDADATSYPGAAEVCDGNDNDCDATIPADETDDDGDLYVECSTWNDSQADQPTILGGADCDDADATSYPGAAEVCDGNDNDCDATVPADETDDDGDLYVECSTWNDSQADQPTILGGADCDDADATSYPGAAEVCDGNDNDCDATVPADETDDDGDLYVECSTWNDSQADQPTILGGADCDDADATSYPGAAEVCDGNDNDCDATVPADEIDDDGDLYVECSTWNDSQADQPTILGGADCDDADATSYPGAAEVCDGNDNDCDATVPADETDDDGDLYVECSTWNDSQADQPTILGGADCDDAEPTSFPGAPEICDAVDNSCSGSADDGDGDMDGFLVCDDCDDGNTGVHAVPSEVVNLRFPDADSLQWEVPASPGGSTVTYDLVRSDAPDGFVLAGTCVESGDGADTQAIDTTAPAVGAGFYYLARAANACGTGSAGTDTSGGERLVTACP